MWVGCEPKLPIWMIYWYALFLEQVFEWWNADEFPSKNVHFHKISYINTCTVHHDISCGETLSQNFLYEWCMLYFWNRCRMMKCWYKRYNYSCILNIKNKSLVAKQELTPIRKLLLFSVTHDFFSIFEIMSSNTLIITPKGP